MWRSLLLTSLLFLPILVACGDSNATVSGNVTFNGEPVNRGMISLEPVDGKGSTAGGSVDGGKFYIQGVLPGDKIVRISAVFSKGMEKQPDGSEVELVDDLLPPSWGLQSKEQWKIEAPKTSKDFPITGPDPRSTAKSSK